MKSKFIIIMALLAVACWAPVAGATLIFGTGSTGASFTAEFTYDNATQTVTVDITNTSPLTGNWVTDFAFNIPSGVTVTAVTFTPDATFNLWNLYGGPSFDNTIPGQNFGFLDIGAGTGEGANAFLGNHANNGIPPANPDLSGMYTFALTGSGLDTLTTADFINALSTGGNAGSAFFLVRFQGGAETSDLVPGLVPIAPSVLLLGSGLLGLGLLGWRRKAK